MVATWLFEIFEIQLHRQHHQQAVVGSEMKMFFAKLLDLKTIILPGLKSFGSLERYGILISESGKLCSIKVSIRICLLNIKDWYNPHFSHTHTKNSIDIQPLFSLLLSCHYLESFKRKNQFLEISRRYALQQCKQTPTSLLTT